MKTFLLCYVIIGCLVSIWVKQAIDYIGIDSLMSQLDEKPENFDPNSPMNQFLFILISVLLWPVYVFGIFRDNGDGK